jgi:hypothetical protein
MLICRSGEPVQRGWASVVTAIHLVRVDALDALGRTTEADDALRRARDHVAQVAGTVADPALRHSFEALIPANARALALASERFGSEKPYIGQP